MPFGPPKTVEPEHVCALAPVTETEAINALVDIMRTAGSASAIYNRLFVRGFVIARRVQP